MTLEIAQMPNWKTLAAVTLLASVAGFACFAAAGSRPRHAGLSGAAEWASLRLLDDDLLTLCVPRGKASGEAERRRRMRMASLYCRGG